MSIDYLVNCYYLYTRNPNNGQARYKMMQMTPSQMDYLESELDKRIANWKSQVSEYDHDHMYRSPAFYSSEGQYWDILLSKDGKVVATGLELKGTIKMINLPEKALITTPTSLLCSEYLVY